MHQLYHIINLFACQVNNSDLDIIVTEQLWIQIAERYNPPAKVALSGDTALELTIHLEIFRTWPPFEETGFLIDAADIINGVRYVKLEHVLEWKSWLGREKDREDINNMRRFLAEHRVLGK